MLSAFLKSERARLYLIIFISIIARIMPHPANATPITALAVMLSLCINRWITALFILLSLIISDSFLALLHGYNAFGDWTLFTYSGWLSMVLLISFLRQNHQPSPNKSVILVLCASCYFWLWTNFGSWLTSGMYVHSVKGLSICFLAGLPFLRHALIANLVWLVLIRFLFIKPILNKYYLFNFADHSN